MCIKTCLLGVTLVGVSGVDIQGGEATAPEETGQHPVPKGNAAFADDTSPTDSCTLDGFVKAIEVYPPAFLLPSLGMSSLHTAPS